MNPNTKITFETLTGNELTELNKQTHELEKLVTTPPQETTVHITANPKDNRHIATHIADTITGTHPATTTTEGITVDLSDHLTARLALIDPYNEGYPYEHAETTDET